MLMLPVLLGMNYINFEDENTTNLVITGYVTVQVLTFAIYYYIYSKIQSSRATASPEPFVVKAPPLPFGQQNPTPDKEMTAVQYDLSKFTELVKQSIIGVCIISFIFYKWESPKPLFLQMVMTPSAVLESELFLIYVLGRAAEGKLTRPWAPAPGMFDQLKEAAAAGAPPEEQAAAAVRDKPADKQRKAKQAKASEPEAQQEPEQAEAKQEVRTGAVDPSCLEQVD